MSPSGHCSKVACLLEDFAPLQDWEEVEVTPEAVKLDFSNIGSSLKKQSAREEARTMG